MRAGFAGVFGLFSPCTVVVAANDLRAMGVLAFPPLAADPDKTGLKTLGDFSLSFLPLAAVAVATETFGCLFPGWKNGLAAGEPNTKVADLLRLVMVGLNVTSAGLP